MTGALLLILIAFLLAGWIQGLIGFGFAMVTTLLLLNNLNFTTLVFFNLSMSVLTCIIAMLSAKNLRTINKPMLVKIITSATAGLVVGLLVINYINPIVLKKVTLVIILIASILSLSKVKAFFAHGYMSWVAGFLSGILTPSTGINGPLVALNLNATFTDKQEIRNTMLAYLFLIMTLGSISMGLSIDLNTSEKTMLLWIIPVSVIGYLLGMLTFRRVSHEVFSRLITVFLIFSSVLSLLYLFLIT